MEQIKCPGQDTRYWKPGDIFAMECPKCGAEIEFFKDDTRRRCAWCGHLFYNPRIEMGCAEYCQYADKCVPELFQERQANLMFKEQLRERVLAVSRKDQAQADRLDQGLKYAADLLKAEGGDPKVVMAAIILHEVTVDQAREILADMETEPEMAAAIMAVLSGSPDADPANRDLVQDVLALLQTGGAPAHFATKTAARLAATQ
jgi:DNA-directed RNA polymerase subunit RPC12/RpoP